MSEFQFALLNTGHRENDTEYDNIIRNFNRELDVDIDNYAVMDHELPELAEYDAGIIPGSSSSVYWDDEWIQLLKDWVTRAVETDFPILGVCYGHQVLAEVLGGEVSQMDEYELGYHEIEQIGESRLMEGIPDPFVAFTSHMDRVEELPPGCTAFAENDRCLHGFSYQSSYAVQFHPEYDMAMARETIEGKDLSEEKLRRARESVNEENYTASKKVKRLLDNFIEIVQESTGSSQ